MDVQDGALGLGHRSDESREDLLKKELTTLRAELEQARKRECTEIERNYMRQILAENANLRKEVEKWPKLFEEMRKDRDWHMEEENKWVEKYRVLSQEVEEYKKREQNHVNQ